MKKLLLPILVLSAASLSAQQITRCASYEHMQDQIAADPSITAIIDAQEAKVARFEQEHPNGYQTRAVITIPVVFHVVYANATENISTLRLQEQLAVLNEDYRKVNSDVSNVPSAWTSLAADCEVQFCMAARDPNGVATTGIERISSSVSSWSTNDNVKHASSGGADAWNADAYLNIWICDLGGGLLGYAQFPGLNPATDGVVLDFAYTGKTGAISPYNLGRTATHEVGHWLGLKHIWGDDGTSCTGSDLVSDTPSQGPENYGCPAIPTTDNCQTASPGVMSMNYMDYTDDACMYFFTTGQKTRMWGFINGSRPMLATSNGCVPVGITEQPLSSVFTLYPNPTDGQVTLDFGSAAQTAYDIAVFNTLGEKVQAAHFEMRNEQTMMLDLRNQSAGLYLIEIRSKNEKITRRIVVQ